MNLVDGFKPLFFLSRVFGMAPYTFNKNNMENSHLLTTYSSLLFLTNLTCQSIFVIYILLNDSSSFVERLLQSLDSITFAVNCLGCTLLILLRRKIMLNIIQQLNNFSLKFLPQYRLRELKKLSIGLSIFSFCFSLVFSITDGIVMLKTMKEVSLGIMYYLFLCSFIRILICYLTCCHFVFYLTLIKLIHCFINKSLIKLSNCYKKNLKMIDSGGPEGKNYYLNGFKFLIETDGWIKDLTEQCFSTFSLYGVCISAVVLFEIVYITVFYYMTSTALSELLASIVLIFYFLSQFFGIVIVSVLSVQEV